MEEDFKSWFLSHGGAFHPNTDLGSNSDGFFIRVRDEQDLLPGARVDPFIAQFDLQSVSLLITPRVITQIFFMKQFLLREQSLWWPYIRMLPQPDALHNFNTPLWYEPEDLAWIRGTNLEFGAQRMESLWRQEYEEAASLFRLRGSEQVEFWSWLLYKWAATIFASRSFPGSALASSAESVGNALNTECPVLIPGVDLLNHCPLVKVTWLWGRSDCSVINDDPIKRTSQVWNNYGPKSNEELILGYGFSLFRNPADFCSLAVSQDVEKRISKIKNYQTCSTLTDMSDILTTGGLSKQTSQVSNGSEHVIDTPDLGKDRNNVTKSIFSSANVVSPNLSPPTQRVNREIRLVRLKGGSLKSDSIRSQALYEFSPGFIGDCSIAFANEREVAESDFQLQSSVDFSSGQLSRNKLHVMCAVTMILQRQQMAIMKHDLDLPLWPANEKQFHAARYRRNQLQILASVIEMLLESLRSFPGLSMATAGDMKVIRLENILTDSTTNILTDFRAALNAGLGTRNPEKIRKNGWVECAFALWLCGLWLRYSSIIRDTASLTSSLPSKFSRWLVFLSRVYRTPPEIEPQREQMVEPVKSGSYVTSCTEITAAEQNRDETQSLCESFLAVIHAAATRNPSSLYGDPSVTVGHLAWCLNIIRQEGVMCPNLEGKLGDENDEFILFLEGAGAA
ncbi:hypothetical protein MMC22_005161 [Lobaria immixta]|nr:hypothetical protein [Lobaria immixta]